ncbi:outer membrane beta-barrel protein [Winogradskyella sp.]|uniref:outer membrane beta-barrel protein n=1 Tax=Winogradskyella sp. TaxID=1883156 RepID=UPI002638C65F|nr:outer membrane beta-barrel protein [Winogradskyella sp.]
MKFILLPLVLLFYSYGLWSQSFDYGITLGGNLYEIQSSGGLQNESGTTKFKIYVGGYGDYQISDKIGAILYVAYNQKTLNVGGDVDFSFIDFSPAIKYVPGSSYSKGFFFELGPRFSLLSSAEANNTDVKSLYESTNIGIQLGIGYHLLDYLELLLKLDYGFTALYDVGGTDRTIFGGILTLNLDINKILNTLK